jgi:aspartoacylase
MKKQKLLKEKPYKEILFLTAVHGDEKLGFEVMETLEKIGFSNRFDWIIANKKALEKGVRFVDIDLNRSAPGNKNSKKYELKKAYELIEVSKNYSYVIDIHGATVDCGIFIIVSNPKLENLFLATSIPVKRVVIWAAEEWKRFGPVTQFVDCGIEIECGPKDSRKIKKKLVKVITSIIEKGLIFNLDSIKKKEFYFVYGKLSEGKVKRKKVRDMKDFKKTTMGGEAFYPLLTGQYENVICYKMKKIDFFDLFSY